MRTKSQGSFATVEPFEEKLAKCLKNWRWHMRKGKEGKVKTGFRWEFWDTNHARGKAAAKAGHAFWNKDADFIYERIHGKKAAVQIHPHDRYDWVLCLSISYPKRGQS